jgi:hypothetical protein
MLTAPPVTRYVGTMTIISVNLDDTQELSIKERRRNVLPPFRITGRAGMTHKHKLTGVDICDVFPHFSSNASWLFFFVAKHMDPCNNSLTLSKVLALDDATQRRVIRAYEQLKGLGVMVRTGKGTYMIHPKLVIPGNQAYFTETWARWEEACAKAKVDPDFAQTVRPPWEAV